MWGRDGTLVAELPGFGAILYAALARGGKHLLAADDPVVRAFALP